MGILGKFKKIFYDEIEIDEKEDEFDNLDKMVKKEPEVKKPKVEKIVFDDIDDEEFKPKEVVKEEKKEENAFSERDLFRSERTFNFTEFDDPEPLPPRKSILEVENRNRNNTNTNVSSRVNEPVKPEVPKEPKVFKPSPIISPIYGILNKDYKKEEIREKVNAKETARDITKSKITTYDTVRRKAYGTLEDDLEDTLNDLNSLTSTQIEDEIYKEEPKKETKKSKIEDLISKIEDVSDEIDRIDTSLSIGELEDNVKLDGFDNDDIVVSDKTMTDSSLEHDLFNLIDSMYDDKEE